MFENYYHKLGNNKIIIYLIFDIYIMDCIIYELLVKFQNNGQTVFIVIYDKNINRII